MKRREVRPKKSLGQHFLVDEAVARRIADTVDAAPEMPVLEVGPGTGALTEHLLVKGRDLHVVELDRESIAYLKEHFPMLRGERLIEGDFLRMDLAALFGGKPFVLTGNYPYNISSQIFFKMLDYRDLIPCCTGMIQREVALRLCSGPGNRDYGILSVLLQAWYDTEYLFTVEESAFNPPPKVKSAVVRFTRNSVTDLGCDERLFRRVVKTTFNQRRKMMRGSIRPLLAQLDNENSMVNGQWSTPKGSRAVSENEVAMVNGPDHSAFLSLPVLTKRPEQLSVQDFVDLTNAVERECCAELEQSSHVIL